MTLIDRLHDALGAGAVLTEPADVASYVADWTGRFRGSALAVVRPADTEQVAAVVRLCAETGTAVVPQGGNTGLAGGATPDDTGRAVVVSLERMRRVRAVDPVADTITVEAGVVLQTLQEQARAA